MGVVERARLAPTFDVAGRADVGLVAAVRGVVVVEADVSTSTADSGPMRTDSVASLAGLPVSDAEDEE
ncbi:hypothetical protein ADL03_26875 [Nocardia sp. NRRL S-836]|nr:hypothetical protein ADL03_26875 [Nocardia sp. NRRL S-836]